MSSAVAPGAQVATTAASASSYKRLARLLVRAFYNGPCPPKTYRDPGDVEGLRSKLGKVDTTGLGIILMDYLLTKEWVGEADIVEDIKVHQKLVRRALKYLEQEHLLMSEHRRETRRSQKKDVVKAVMDANAEAAKDPAAGDGEEGAEQLLRPHTISYYAVDFPRMFDALQLRLHIMRKVLKDELDCSEVLAKYVCEGSWCKKEHDSLGVHWLMNPETGELHCDICNSLVKRVLASGETGDENTRRARREMIASRLERMDKQLHDMSKAIAALRNSNAPFYGTLRDWAVSQQAIQQRQQAQGSKAGGLGGRGGNFGGAGGLTGALASVAASTSYWEDTQVEVNLSGPAGGGAEAAAASGAGAGAGGRTAAAGKQGVGETKPVLPPWMLRPAGGADGSGAGGAGTGAGADTKAGLAGGSLGDAEVEERQKAYVQAYMKAMMEKEQERQLQQQQALAVQPAQSGDDEPSAKRTKQEPAEMGSQVDTAGAAVQLPTPEVLLLDDDDDIEWAPVEVPAVAAPAPLLPAASPQAGADDGDEWEDI